MGRVLVKSSYYLAIAMIVMLAGYVEAQWWSTSTTTPTTSVPDLNECISELCQNGGTCEDGVNSYSCSCTVGWTGTNCETINDVCASSPCQNDGDCLGVSYSLCMCKTGTTGILCQIAINCPSDIVAYTYSNRSVRVTWPAPTVRGGNVTINQIKGLASGSSFSVRRHEIEYTATDGAMSPAKCSFTVEVIDPCLTAHCYNGGECMAYHWSPEFYCQCVPGFTGDDCKLDFDECATAPCRNGGACVDGVNSYSCSCTVGWTGFNCETLDPFDNCPESIRVDLPRGETQAYVTWDKPRVQVDLHVLTAPDAVNASHTPGSFFSVGHHRVVYKYIYGTFPFDTTSKYKECKFDINITSLLGPFVRSCPRDVQIELPSNETMAYVTWSEPRVIGLGTDHVVSFIVDKERKTHPGSYFLVGETKVTYQFSTLLNQTESLCSFSVGVNHKNEPGATPAPVNEIYCSNTNTLILGSLLAIAIVSFIGSCSLYFRMKRRPSSGVTRSMVPLDTILKSKTVNNSGSFADSVDPPRYTNRNINHGPPSLPPVPPPKPSVPLPMDDPGLQNTYEALDNYGYMCLELKKQNRDAYQMPRALYEKQNY